jgi:hypothetical protein
VLVADVSAALDAHVYAGSWLLLADVAYEDSISVVAGKLLLAAAR